MPKKGYKRPPIKFPGAGEAPVDIAVDADGEPIVGPGHLLMFPGRASSCRVRLYREDDRTKKWNIHGMLAVDEASEMLVSEMFGGGRWVMQLIEMNAEGQQGIRSTKAFTVPGAYRPPTGPLPGAVSAAVIPLPNGSGTTAASMPGGISINEALDQVRLQQVLDIVKQGQAVRESPSPVPWDRIFDVGIKLVELMGTRHAPDPTADLREEVARLRDELRKPVAGPVTSSLSDMTAAIGQLMDVRDRIKGVGEGDEEGGGGMMRMGLDLIKTLAQAQQAGQPVSPAEGAAMPSRIPGKTEVPAPQPVAGPLWQRLLQNHGRQLVDAASRGLQPDFIAEVVLTYLPSDQVGVLTEFLARPDAASIAIQEIPALGEFATWNVKFWSALKAAMEPELELDE